MKVTDAQYSADAQIWLRVIHDGAVLGASDRQKGGFWVTFDGEQVWRHTPVGEFLPTLGVYPGLGRIGITCGGRS
jgi:hypothetical protein